MVPPPKPETKLETLAEETEKGPFVALSDEEVGFGPIYCAWAMPADNKQLKPKAHVVLENFMKTPDTNEHLDQLHGFPSERFVSRRHLLATQDRAQSATVDGFVAQNFSYLSFGCTCELFC
jgi:hypothetical protein